jgi:hypothetical protein
VGGIIGSSGSSSGGSGGSGPTIECGASFMMGSDGFVRAPVGTGKCWHGYAYAGASMGMAMPTSFASCAAPCMLSFSGSLMEGDSATAYIGFNVNQATGAADGSVLMPTGTGLTVSFTKSGTFDVRVQIQSAAGDFCAPATTSPAAIPYSMFRTECWGTTGTAFTPASGMTAIQLIVPGKADMAQDFELTLTDVKEM